MILALLAANVVAPTSANWKVMDESINGKPTCGITQSFDDGTAVLFVVDEENVKLNQFSFMARNETWSIHEGDRIGDIAVRTNPYAFGSLAQTGPRLFIIGSFIRGLIPFLRAASDNGFTIEISESGKVIGPYASSGLKPAVDNLDACVRRRFSKANDPFAK